MEMIKNYINGAMVLAHSGATMSTFEPAIGVEYAELPVSNSDDVNNAVDAAASGLAWTGSIRCV